ncbi:dTDP-4-dehydrorhamnose 3,5-epimerase family protein [Dactylosporangium sp. CA-233914]|uniref:dTDP-4-dehydrorhamnose 3,5-epimerase family protein n=1 Tax=Dactylosporangium sp. CA-233914 TaxID=3239934 RepID=UPI003D948446
MKVRPLAVTGSWEFTPVVHGDQRGAFVSPLLGDEFTDAVGHRLTVAQTNFNRSAKGVLRGIHFTSVPPGQAKYVCCSRGRAIDAVIDLRVGSPTFGVWDSVELDPDTWRSVYLPVGVGHAFLALEDDTIMSYLVSTGYVAEREQTLDAMDAELGLPWPRDMAFVRSERDVAAVGLLEARRRGLLPGYEACLAAEREAQAGGAR